VLTIENGFSSLPMKKLATLIVGFSLAAAALSARATGASEAGPAATGAADTTTTTNKKKEEELDEVVVTGSLIPQARAETSQPITVITAEEIQSKGFATVAEALQHTSFATGAVQNPQLSNQFTPGAQVVSFFGLSPSYTKYLIDGRPIADYPALYNGTDIITSITGIPTVLVDTVDLLPGGQSSIYGSDAIAGVVNIHLVKKMDGPQADVRYGWTKDGGGTQRRIAIGDGFSLGPVNVIVGGQYERTSPIWGYQRPLSNEFFAQGPSPQTAERTYLVFGLFPQANGNTYYFEDPSNCANVASGYGGTVGLHTRGSRGQYCGTDLTGWSTINNGTESTQGMLHVSDDVNDHIQIFTDVLVDHDVTRTNPGTTFFSTADDSSGPYNYFVDPNVDPNNLINVQHIFTPEEAGNLAGQDNKNTINSIRATVGVQGDLWGSNWKYLVDMTYTENKLTEATHLAFTSKIDAFFASVFGPNIGPDPNFGQPEYNVDWAAFYKPITPAQYASFTGYAYSYSRTEDSLARAEVTNASLFKLPGGDAGLALLVEGGGQGWDYAPDPRYLDGETYLYTATAGSGHRSRYAGTAEVRLPVLSMLSFDLSTRYDDYKVSNQNVSKSTYNLGVEFRPLQKLLIRGKYGTAFKAPTLSDEFQGQSGFFTSSSTDYYTCYKAGYTASNISNCPQAGQSLFGTTSGNTNLKPITAKVAGAGIAWAALPTLNVTFDFLHWKIDNEVQEEDSDQLLRTEAACRLGQLDITSPTCVNALANVIRDSTGVITQINTPKVNVADESLNAIILKFNYTIKTAYAGNFTFDASYSNVLKHDLVRFPGDPTIDLLRSPFYSTEFKTREDASLTYDYAKFSTTLYMEHYGRTPNYLAQQAVDGYATPGAARLPTWTVTNLSAKYEVLPGLTVSANAINLFDKLPPIDYSTPGIYSQPFNVQNFNNYGRSYFIDASYKFGK
jgi:outer membrane receptor protein involved in Fe transport